MGDLMAKSDLAPLRLPCEYTETIGGMGGYLYPTSACVVKDSMRRDQVISKLKAVEPAIRALGASALYLYGSHAREEARPDSDVDVFIDKDPSRHFGFDEFMGIYLKLRETLDADVGYTTREGLVEFYRPDIEREAIRVF